MAQREGKKDALKSLLDHQKHETLSIIDHLHQQLTDLEEEKKAIVEKTSTMIESMNSVAATKTRESVFQAELEVEALVNNIHSEIKKAKEQISKYEKDTDNIKTKLIPTMKR